MSVNESELGTDSEYSQKVGERLRAIRRQKRMSLQDVESQSDHEFKASVLGAYERGERAISVPRLHRLATYYNVPVDQLLPRSSVSSGRSSDVLDLTDSTHAIGGILLDLAHLEEIPGPEGEMLGRYLSMIQVQRQDFNGKVLTIRKDDLRAVACILGVEIDFVLDRLADLKLTRA